MLKYTTHQFRCWLTISVACFSFNTNQKGICLGNKKRKTSINKSELLRTQEVYTTLEHIQYRLVEVINS